jgi:RND family efflux transporter MFP subunit
MKRSLYLLLISSSILAACGGDGKDGNKAAELAKLKTERTAIDVKIQKLETEVNKNTPQKATPVTVIALQQTHFSSYVEVQSEIEGDQDVNASSQAPGTVENILVRVGQRVGRGAILATLDAAAIEQQIKAIEPNVTLAKTLYEKQQKLWAQNIGTEVQLLSAKAQYESAQKQKAALVAQRAMYTIKSPISGTVDAINVKIGDVAAPGNPTTGIRVVNTDQLKAEASLGENYIGKVKTGDPVLLVFPDLNDSIKTKVSYVAQGVDPISRAFKVQVRLGGNKKLHPNMSAKMKISNYENASALVVPVSVIQKTADGDMLYIADGNKAKAVFVKTGRTANGNIEILEGLNAGDKVIVEGYEELDNGEAVAIK